jgi:hypothetical protein
MHCNIKIDKINQVITIEEFAPKTSNALTSFAFNFGIRRRWYEIPYVMDWLFRKRLIKHLSDCSKNVSIKMVEDIEKQTPKSEIIEKYVNWFFEEMER